MEGKKIYFASDFHLGAPSYQASRAREDRIIRWMDMIREDASEIYLMGDIFDFWFEYKRVVPRGFIRFQGKLAELSDAGIKLTLFKGNHDMWMFNYFQQEMGVSVISDELVIERGGKRFFLHHGDGLGPGDAGYKLLKRFFRSSVCQWFFARLHPNFAFWIAQSWSSDSRARNGSTEKFTSAESEWLFKYSEELLRKEHYDYLIFGHRHLPLDLRLGQSRYINLGEWMNYNSYAVFDGDQLELKYFEQETLPPGVLKS